MPTTVDRQQLVQATRDAAGVERRFGAVRDLRIERRAAGEPIGFTGHAAVFNDPTYIRTWIGGFHEQVAPGAFKKTIAEADIRMLFNHDGNFPLARNKNATLRLSEDEVGLLTEADMLPTTYAQDLALALERGDVSQMSFGFDVIKDTWGETDTGAPLRTLNEVKLWDVSPVTFPAYPQTDASLRGAQLQSLFATLGLDTIPDDERAEVLAGLAAGAVPSARLAHVRAAWERLGELVRRSEPAPATPPAVDVPDASRVSTRAPHLTVMHAQADLMSRGLALR